LVSPQTFPQLWKNLLKISSFQDFTQPHLQKPSDFWLIGGFDNLT